MVQEHRCADEILLQVSAAKAALNQYSAPVTAVRREGSQVVVLASMDDVETEFRAQALPVAAGRVGNTDQLVSRRQAVPPVRTLVGVLAAFGLACGASEELPRLPDEETRVIALEVEGMT